MLLSQAFLPSAVAQIIKVHASESVLIVTGTLWLIEYPNSHPLLSLCKLKLVCDLNIIIYLKQTSKDLVYSIFKMHKKKNNSNNNKQTKKQSSDKVRKYPASKTIYLYIYICTHNHCASDFYSEIKAVPLKSY